MNYPHTGVIQSVMRSAISATKKPALIMTPHRDRNCVRPSPISIKGPAAAASSCWVRRQLSSEISKAAAATRIAKGRG